MLIVLIPTLVFLAVLTIGGAVLVVRHGRRSVLEARLQGESAFRSPYSPSAELNPLTQTLEKVGKTVSSDKPADPGLREKLAQAGHYGESAPAIYQAAQLLLLLAALVVATPVVLLLQISLLWSVAVVFIAVAVAALLPNLVVTLQRRRRTAEVRQQLPDAIDLLEICVSSGMGLDMAWNAVTDEFRTVSPTLTDEMALVNLEIHLGAARADALRHMAYRTGVNDINSLVATLVQSERFGTSVAQALRTYADAMRLERSQRAEEAAEKLMVKLLFPMVLFIFPVIFIVILGPAGIKIYDMFASG